MAYACLIVLSGAVIFVGLPAYANTEKDALVKLNVMNLDCTVDQVYAGNSPTYIVNPAGCNIEPIAEIIDKTTNAVSPAAEPSQKPLIDEAAPIEVPSSVMEVFSVPTIPSSFADISPTKVLEDSLSPSSPESTTTSIVITSTAIGVTAVASTIVVDALIFNSQLITTIGSTIRRIVQFIAGLFIKV